MTAFKLFGNGALHWLQQIGGVRVDQCHGVGFDFADNAYATGYFQQSATFGTTTLSNPTNARANTAFILPNTTLTEIRYGHFVQLVRDIVKRMRFRFKKIIVFPKHLSPVVFQALLGFGDTKPLGGVISGGGFFLASLDLSAKSGVTFLDNSNKAFRLYPNPSNTNTTIEFMRDEVSVVEITLTDALGRVVKANTFDLGAGKQSIQLSTNDLSAGIYFCNVTASGKQIGSSKLIIE